MVRKRRTGLRRLMRTFGALRRCYPRLAFTCRLLGSRRLRIPMLALLGLGARNGRRRDRPMHGIDEHPVIRIVRGRDGCRGGAPRYEWFGARAVYCAE